MTGQEGTGHVHEYVKKPDTAGAVGWVWTPAPCPVGKCAWPTGFSANELQAALRAAVEAESLEHSHAYEITTDHFPNCGAAGCTWPIGYEEEAMRLRVRPEHTHKRDGDAHTVCFVPGCTWPEEPPPADAVDHPKHYTSHPSGVECITVTEHMGFNLGNAIKCIWRADEKGNALEDLRKAAWYVQREIERRQRSSGTS